jgi:exo-1,4-beta-D-glucosaminidase
LDVAADGVARSFAIPEPNGISSTYFLSLQLLSSTGQLVSRNFYWLSSKPDVLNFDKTEWYYTPQTDFADFTSLQTLPAATVKATWKSLPGNDHDNEYQVTLHNAGTGLAFLVHMRLVRAAGKSEVLPVFWEDNYISLLPGERREVRVHVRKSDLGGAHPELILDGFNVAPETIHAAR